ncbi:MAG: hypothetical protein QE164_05155 [Candidatus Nezhaarchaeota archaeon]|nr:hypothetical protein [Candidatus Nezhaarchaeota archaeon]
MPKQCEAKCEFFRCARKALVRVPGNPHVRFVAYTLMCRETGGECLEGKCQYATCIRSALLPNSMCGLEYRIEKRPVRSLEQEVRKYEEKYGSILERFKGKKLAEDML